MYKFNLKIFDIKVLISTLLIVLPLFPQLPLQLELDIPLPPKNPEFGLQPKFILD